MTRRERPMAWGEWASDGVDCEWCGAGIIHGTPAWAEAGWIVLHVGQLQFHFCGQSCRDRWGEAHQLRSDVSEQPRTRREGRREPYRD